MKFVTIKSIYNQQTQMCNVVLKGKEGKLSCQFIIKLKFQTSEFGDHDEVMLWEIDTIYPLVNTDNVMFNKYVYLVCRFVRKVSKHRGFSTEGWYDIDFKMVEREVIAFMRECSL